MALRLTSATRAEFPRAVVFSCDANYAPFALHAAAQIHHTCPGRDFDICLVSTDAFDVPDSLSSYGIRHCFLETGGAFAGMKLDRRRTEAVYSRLALPEIFAEDYRRLLYLDADVFIQGGDFAALMDLDLGPHAIAAVRDNIQWRTPTRQPEAFAIMGKATAPYFNSGVMLIDVPAFQSADLMSACMGLSKGIGQRFPGHDQNLLNAVLYGNWAELSPVWNWQYTWASRLFEAMEDAHIVHFIGRKKPWAHDEGEIPLRFRRAYAAFFATHFPGRIELPAAAIPPHKNTDFLRKALVKHLFSLNKMSRYLSRFSGPLDVKLRSTT